MLELNKKSIKNNEEWQKAGIGLPKFDCDIICENSKTSTKWVHFGEGNLFRAFIAPLMQQLIEKGLSTCGVTAVATYERQTLDIAYKPFDNLCLQVTMHPDGKLTKNVIGSITESLVSFEEEGWLRLCEIFKSKELQIVSLTITEKAYNIKNHSGTYNDTVLQDIGNGAKRPVNTMAIVASLLYARFKAGKYPVALVSMDNFSHNGDRLKESTLQIIKEWNKRGHVEDEFVKYAEDTSLVSFPWTMVDKITPRPSQSLAAHLKNIGLACADIHITDKGTYIAPFVNTEPTEYLVMEDSFPNGRLPLEHAGVYFANRETVDLVERMKVCTCLNPLHTALAVFGCLLGYKTISDEMKDAVLLELIKKIGYTEGMPVVSDPKIINPAEFIREVIEERFSNPYIPDTPQRIAADTSQKIPVRFGETLKMYMKNSSLDIASLKYIPIVFAGWCRYLMGISDSGGKMEISPDPMLDNLQAHISKIKFGDISSVSGNLAPVLSNKHIFGIDLYTTPLGQKTEGYFRRMIEGKGAVLKLLKSELPIG